MTETLCFDMYGTLCDTSSVRDALRRELDASEALVGKLDGTWRDKQLQYSYQAALMDAYRPFGEVTADALAYALDQWGVATDESTRGTLLAAYDRLDPYPDAVETLDRLSEAGHEVTVLSNGDPEMLSALASNAGLDDHLDRIVSADEASTFKPDPAVYDAAAERADRPLGDCRLVSGNAWDVAGASAAGMATAWVNRGGDPFERVGGEPSLEVDALAGVADELA
ncbi:haloacid dehalogenase type II [Candidatus Halobonum tyrrellensis]|uniref:Haloacid dehalogenase, type II n=1 Tax=Candidatus Halobonum tyrrellensis G22 TaxID=1324957 RepID=V4HPQ4_9EURY|nr:haloacid dehalogenase type II [Candidatus Halobonum tyrrellensis]ESP89879.1 haloacid dehalogenase, type II [Candidatus Halobonum tyrrellensis G22]